MFVTVTNRGALVLVDRSRDNCQDVADEINAKGGDVFAWVQEVPANTVQEDIPGKGKWYM